ncbi:hypothetical protein JN11_02197 [Mucilaginibacter frigoritolerans]|jgi:hypothetical protein|uniref:Uncharacterized protein n=1 Tax=Mucilaginibacter frigoritolerans TaxID=652788 RepID=A0A562U596_9SPHI|nr:hypothetical protein [Mucilaginibacter frigoritolerans]TWJ00934.1 hypothetical protein JN11_02197 [Mucilaginibacter frigoritolerans]
MGFLGLLPADQLSAFYDSSTKQLSLYAQGSALEFTSGISFYRDTFFGGLKFSLMGWTGPITGKQQPYEHKQAFSIYLPQPNFNSKSVLIVTANNPEGVAVPIYYSGIIPPTTGLETSNAANPAADAVVSTASPDATQLNVLFKLPFNITENAIVPKFGSVDIKYDPSILQIVTAGILDSDIVWTFNSLQTGDTQIVVTIHGGIAQFVISKTYDVKIFVL